MNFEALKQLAIHCKQVCGRSMTVSLIKMYADKLPEVKPTDWNALAVSFSRAIDQYNAEMGLLVEDAESWFKLKQDMENKRDDLLVELAEAVLRMDQHPDGGPTNEWTLNVLLREFRELQAKARK